MSETNKTLAYGIVALVLVLIAFLSAPQRVAPDELADQGEVFFPEFEDPNKATTLEVVEFDEDTASARPFKVTFEGGRWTIPSHHDYPADGEDRLAQTAAAMIGLTKDTFRTSNVADHEETGVIDPLSNETASLRGRGKRVTIKGAGGEVLADLIFGKKLEDRPDFRFVRVPGQKRVYAVRTDLEISTRFADWIESDLLQVERDEISRVIIRDYSINERSGSIDRRDTITLMKDEEGDWSLQRMPSGQEVDQSKINQLLRAVDELSIVGVRPKMAGLTEDLRQAGGDIPLSRENIVELQRKGYYFTRDGQLLSNEGEVEVQTENGVRYLLRFGEVLYGEGEAVSAGGEGTEDEESGPGENRYLFITADFEPNLLPDEPSSPSSRSFEGKPESEMSESERRDRELAVEYDEWEDQRTAGEEKAEELNRRFAEWYYVISSDSFENIHVARSDLIQSDEG